MPRLYHKGTITAEAGVAVWAITISLASLQGHGFGVDRYWIATGLLFGLLLCSWGIGWELRTDNEPVSMSALSTLYWYARYCDCAKTLVERTDLPTWREAFEVERRCRKR